MAVRLGYDAPLLAAIAGRLARAVMQDMRRSAKQQHGQGAGASAEADGLSAELLCGLIEVGPQAAGYTSGVWTGPMIGDLIEKHFGVQYHNHHIPRLLNGLGFSVQEWLAANRHRIELFRLPPYSPELNPIEGVWKTTKRTTTHNRFFRTTTERDAALTATFEHFNAKPASIAGHVARFL